MSFRNFRGGSRPPNHSAVPESQEDAAPARSLPVSAPVWQSLVSDSAFQEQNREGIREEGRRIDQGIRIDRDNERERKKQAALAAKPDKWKPGIGTLQRIRGADGVIEDHDPESLLDDPEAGPHAAAALFKRDATAAKNDVANWNLKLQDPADTRRLTAAQRKEIEGEGSMLAESDPRHVELKKRLVDDDARSADEQAAYEAKVKLQQITQGGVPGWLDRRKSAQPIEDRKAGAIADEARLQAEDTQAAAEETELRTQMEKGMTSAQMDAANLRLAEIRQRRTGIQQAKAGPAEELAKVAADAKIAANGDTRPARAQARQQLLTDTFGMMGNGGAGNRATEGAMKKVGDQGGEGIARTAEKAKDAAGYYGGMIVEGLKGYFTGKDPASGRETEGVFDPALEGADLVEERKRVLAAAAAAPNDVNLGQRADALGQAVRFFESKGIKDGAEMSKALVDAAKLNVWAQGETDLTRTLSDGTLAVNPSLVAERDGTQAMASIDASTASPAEKERAKAVLGQARQEFAANFIPDLSARDKDFAKHAALMQQQGKTNPEEILHSWEGLNSGWMEKNWAVVRDSAMGALRGIESTASGVMGAIEEKTAQGFDAIGAEAAADWFREGAGRQAEEIRQNRLTEEYEAALGAMKGERTGIRGVATDLATTVGQMAPMFAAGPAGRLLAGETAAAGNIAAAGVYGWAGMQGYSSIIGTALQTAEKKAGRQLTSEESSQVFNEAFGPAVANGFQTAILSKIMGAGVERAALGKAAVGTLTVRDMLGQIVKGAPDKGLRGVLTELKPELGAMLKTIRKDFADEAIEESVNQLIEGVLTQATVDPDKQMSDVVKETLYAGLLGGVAGAGVPLAQSSVSRGKGPNPNQGTSPSNQGSSPPNQGTSSTGAPLIPSAPAVNDEATVETVNAAMTAADPRSRAATAEEVAQAQDLAGSIAEAGPDAVAGAVELVRELDAVQFQHDGALEQAEVNLEQAAATGEKTAVTMAETTLEKVRAAAVSDVPRAKGAVKIARGAPLASLTDGELKSLGITREGKPLGKSDLEANGLTKPLVELGDDGSAIILDEAAAMVRKVSPAAAKRIGMTETQARAKATARAASAEVQQGAGGGADAPTGQTFTVTGRNGTTVEVQAENETRAIEAAATQLPLGETVAKVEAKGGKSSKQGGTSSKPAANDEKSPSKRPASKGDGSAKGPQVPPLKMPPDDRNTKVMRAVKTRVMLAKAKLKDRLTVSTKPGDRVKATETGITINAEALVAEAQAAGFDSDRADKWVSDVIDEEVRHYAHLKAAQDLWKSSGSKESFKNWRSDHYGKIWAEEFDGERGSTVANLYGEKAFAALEPWQKAMEGIRMMSQQLVNGDPTEVSKLWANIRKPLRDALRAALNALKDMAKALSEPLQAEIAALERKLQEVEAEFTDPFEGSRIAFMRDGVEEEGKVLKVSSAGKLLVRGERGNVLVGPGDVKRLITMDEAPEASPFDLVGEQIDEEWYRFKDESGTLGIPRDEMPQIHAEDRSAMVQFLRARGIDYAEGRTQPNDLRPTQAEFSAKKVDKARAFKGGDRAILVSEDGYLVDGHHQWLAKWYDAPSEPMRTITLKAPISDILEALRDMPSVETAGGGTSNFSPATASDPFIRLQPEGTPSTATANFEVVYREAGVPEGKEVYELTAPQLLASLQAAERLGVGDWYSRFTNSWGHEIKGKAKAVLDAWIGGDRPASAEKPAKAPKNPKAEQIKEAFAGMAGSISENFYSAIEQSLREKNDVPTPEKKSRIGQAWSAVKTMTGGGEENIAIFMTALRSIGAKKHPDTIAGWRTALTEAKDKASKTKAEKIPEPPVGAADSAKAEIESLGWIPATAGPMNPRSYAMKGSTRTESFTGYENWGPVLDWIKANSPSGAKSNNEPEATPTQWADFQVEYRKLRIALAKARKSGDPRKLLSEATNGLSRFEVTGMWPDSWSDWERAKDEAEFAIRRGETEPKLKPLAVPEEPVADATPAANPPARSEAEQALVDLMKDMVDGLEAAPLSEDFTRALPVEKIGPMVGIAQKFIAEGIATPEAFAASLAKLAGGKLKPFSQALWGAFVMVQPTVDAKPDWAAIYAEPEAPAAIEEETPAAETEEPSEPLTDAGRSGMRAVISEAKRLALTREKFTRDQVAKAADPDSKLSKKELDESIEAGIVAAAYDMTRGADELAALFLRLVRLYENQPSLTAKTSQSKIDQAYSTPIPLAFVASELAALDAGKDTILEPTGGHGALVMGAPSSSTVLYNELNEGRRFRTAMALDTPARGWVMTGEDATTWKPSQKPNKIVANPPFGALMDGSGKNLMFETAAGPTTEIDHAIMLRALGSMTDDGRAVFIIGGPAKTITTEKGRRSHYGKGKRGAFFKHLHDNYGVIDHFTVNGDLYRKQGAGWPVDVIVIQGKGRSKTSLPSAKAPRMVGTWNELFATTQLSDNERISLNTISEAELRAEGGSMADKLASLGGLGGTEIGGRRPDASGRRDAGTGEGSVSEPAEPAREAGRDPGDTGGVDRGGNAPSGDQSAGGLPDTARDAASLREQPDRSGDSPRGKLKESGAFQIEYRPFSNAPGLDTLIPKNMAEPAAAAFERIKRDVGGDLVAFVREKVGYPKGSDISPYLAGEQIDAVAAAIWNFENGGALIIGDQTGIGKGRIAAALMKYAITNGYVPVFVSQKPGLHHDMLVRDLEDVGATEVVPAIMDSKLQFDSAKDRKLQYGKDYFEQVAKTGKLFGGANAIFVTYDQIQADDAPGVGKEERITAANAQQAPRHGWRTDALKTLAANSVIILDESHLASGQSKRGWRTQEVLKLSPRVYYSSATAVKRPENMGIYFRTNVGALTGGDVDEIVKLMTTGGVPAMQVVSSMLARDGQYLRRERSFEGIKFNTHVAVDTEARDAELADNLTWALRNIVTVQDAMTQAAGTINDAINQQGKRMEVPASNRARLEGTNFSAKLHNVVSQYILAIKTAPVAEMAIREIRAGKKVVVALQSTMESALDDLEAGGFPLTYKGLVLKYLDQMRFMTSGKKAWGRGEVSTFEITGEPAEQFKGVSDAAVRLALVHRGTNDLGETILEMNDEAAAELMRRAMWGVHQQALKNVEQAELGNLPLSPIDAIRQAAEDAGIRTGEITGRARGISREGEIYERDPKERDKKNNPRVIAAFNDEDLDLLVINQSGSTGISLHASEKAKNKAVRQMIVAQPNLDINEFMQTLGRIHRSGQVVLPEFTLFQTALPAEKRPAAILGQKMAMLNANTTSNDKTDVSEGNSAVDIFNKYGDEITRAVLDRDEDLKTQLRPLGGSIARIVDGDKAEDQPDGYVARSITGYIAILPVEEQAIYWEKVISEYSAYIGYLSQIGKNELEAKALDMEAETIEREVFTAATGFKSAFEEASFLEKVDTKMGKEPLTGAEAIEISRNARNSSREILRQYAATAQEFIEEATKRKAARSLKWDEDKRKAFVTAQRDQRNTVASAMELLGRMGSIDRDDGTSGLGVLEEIRMDEDKPVTPSAHMAIIRVNDSRETVKVPLTQLQEAFTPVPVSMESASEWDDSRDVGGKRMIITGNLIAAMQAVGNSGKVVTYTTKDGENRIGILMPNSFESAYRQQQARVLIDSAAKLREQLEEGNVAQTSTRKVRIYRDARGRTMLTVPSSRSGGGDLWRNPRLNEMTQEGHFEEVGSEFRAAIPDAKLGAVLEFLTGEGARLYVLPVEGLEASPLSDDAPPFYSALERLIEAKMPATATPGQALQIAVAGKAEEVKWSGIRQALVRIAGENGGKVPKAALLNHLRDEGAVRFQEVTNRDGQSPSAAILEQIGERGYSAYEDGGWWYIQDPDGDDVPSDQIPPDVESLRARLQATGADAGNAWGTAYKQYATPGGTNYREVVLTMSIPGPTLGEYAKKKGLDLASMSEEDADALGDEFDKVKGSSVYTSSHFENVPNYVAHMRLQDFGVGTLIEEIQSDRHQQGRKNGYKGEAPTDDEVRRFFKLRDDANPADYREEMLEHPDFRRNAVPDAPFRKDWPLQMFKRALAQAVAAGKNWIGWTTGDTQADRFDISKQLSEVSYSPEFGILTGTTVRGGEGLDLNDVPPEKIADYIGKDAANKLLQSTPDRDGTHRLKGDGLKTEAPGMKGFYDKILPSEIGKYVRQWGATIEQGSVGGADAGGGFKIGPEGVAKGDASTPIWRVEITPAMRDGVAKGQALFAAPLNDDAAILDDLMERGRKALPSEKVRRDIREQRKEFEDQGKVIGRPDLANISEDDEVRGIVDEVDEWRKFAATRQQRSDWEKEGQRLAFEDEGGIIEKWLSSAYNPEMAMTISPQEVVAARIIMERRAKAAGNDKAAHVEVALLVNGYREARGQQARVLAAGTDPYKNPEQRHRDYLAGVLYELPARVLQDIGSKAGNPAGFRKAVRKAVQERLDTIEKELKKQGVTLDEIIGGQVHLSLSQKNVMKEATKGLSPAEQAALKMIQKGGTVADVRRVSGLDEASAQKMLDGLKAKLREQLREKVAKGMTLEDLREEVKGLKAAPLGDDEIEAELERILAVGFGLPDKIPQQKLPKSRKKKVPRPQKVDWNRPEFTDGLESYTFEAGERAEIMQRLQALREAVGAEGKIDKLTGPKKAEALKQLVKLNRILAKYGTNAEQLAAGFDVDSYRFDITDRAHVLIIARTIQAIDADWIDKGSEYYYASILSGLQTMMVNATGALHSVWDATVGRGVEIAINALVGDPKAASLGEIPYMLKAMGPMLGRAWSNAAAAWGTETPFFEEDVLGKGPDLQAYIEGRGMYRTGSIGGRKGRIIRTPMRILLATDEFVRTATACAEVGAMAYRLARADGLTPGTAEFDAFIAKQVNIPGSPAWVMAAVKASDRAFTSALPGQKDVNTGKKVPIRGIGEAVGAGAGWLTRLLTMEVESKAAKLAITSLRLIFFPFQRVPFNIIRTAARRTINPISMIDIGVLFSRNFRFQDGKWTMDARGEKAEIIERIAQQAQGGIAVLLLAATGAGEGDDDDLTKPILITGSRPFREVKRGERELAYRMGLGPYSISIRRKDGSRLVMSYGRLEPAATVLGVTVDTMREAGFWKQGKQSGNETANKIQNALISQVTEKTFLRGFSEAQQIMAGQTDMNRFAAERLAVLLPNILRQPLRETDPAFRERPDGFIEALSYALVPHGQMPERSDLYGDTQEKRGNAVGRVFDFMEWGTEPKAKRYDEMLWRYRQAHPNDAVAPQSPRASYIDPVTKKDVPMNAAQAARFKELSGRRTLALLGQQSFNFEKPTEADVERFQKAVTKARTEVKKSLINSASFRNLK